MSVFYTGSSSGSGGLATIPEVAIDPVSPSVNETWILATGLIGSPGLAMGIMGLTYTSPVAVSYDLSYYTQGGNIIRVRLS